MIGRHSGIFSGQRSLRHVKARRDKLQTLSESERREQLARIEDEILETTEHLHELKRKRHQLEISRNAA